jgi:hypothetical protein
VSVYEGDAAAIGELIWHWGEAYVISYANGLYHAGRRDNRAQVHAPDPEQLGREIRVDAAGVTEPRGTSSPTPSATFWTEG